MFEISHVGCPPLFFARLGRLFDEHEKNGPHILWHLVEKYSISKSFDKLRQF